MVASEGNGRTVGAYITSDKRGKKSSTTTWMITVWMSIATRERNVVPYHPCGHARRDGPPRVSSRHPLRDVCRRLFE